METIETPNSEDFQAAIDFCESRNISESDLDELVYDYVNEIRAITRNHTNQAEEDLDRQADNTASSINNGGIGLQLAFLIQEYGIDLLKTKLQDL